ncbi:MAG: AAA family ATPase, partial [Terriglobia bacterium]
KGSILLVDEIDTGLHYSVMESVWKFIVETSRAFDVQVFATTHSYDCVYSLARVCRDVDDSQSDISVHRIEAEMTKSIPFTEGDLKIAAEREIEIR